MWLRPSPRLWCRPDRRRPRRRQLPRQAQRRARSAWRVTSHRLPSPHLHPGLRPPPAHPKPVRRRSWRTKGPSSSRFRPASSIGSSSIPLRGRPAALAGVEDLLPRAPAGERTGGLDVAEHVRRDVLAGLGQPSLEEPGEPARPAMQFAWGGAAAVLAIVFLGQVIHENHAWLAAHGPLRGPLQSVYAALGVKVQPPVNLSAYQLRQWGVTGDPNAAGTLRLRASILNTSAQLQPYPLLRVTLANRFGTHVGARDFEPAEYLGRPIARLMTPGERADATLDIHGSRQGCRRVRDRRVPARRRPNNFLRGGCCDAGWCARRRSHERAAANRTLRVELERRARADGRSDRPAVSDVVPPFRRRAGRLRDAYRRCSPLGHAEIAAAHGPSRRNRVRASCRSRASIPR